MLVDLRSKELTTFWFMKEIYYLFFGETHIFGIPMTKFQKI